MVHSFTAAGVLPSQYRRLSMFAEMGVIGKGYVDHGLYIHIFFHFALCVMENIFNIVYKNLGYMDVVDQAAEVSMNRAVAIVKESPDYSQSGEVNVCVCVCVYVRIYGMFAFMYSCIHVNISWQWVITDARHDSTANAFHTTVPCLSGRWPYYMNHTWRILSLLMNVVNIW